MVTITNGRHTTQVTKSVYKNVFKKIGYVIVEEEEKSADEHVGSVEERIDDVEVDKIPVSEMNKEQLVEYARNHNIDTSSAKNVREARQMIQKAIRESKM